MEAAIPGLSDTGALTSTSSSSASNKSFPKLTPAQSAANAAAAGATTTSANGSGPLTQAAGGALDKNAFLKLLVQELTNQDPLKPADNTQFIAQLAQFSTLEQMQNMSDGFTKMQTSFQEAQARGLLGVPITATNSTTGAAVNGTVDQIVLSADGSVKVDVNGTQVNITDVTSVGPGVTSGTSSTGGSSDSPGSSLPGTLVPPSGSGT
jgi:flagellar basal-body rod modification protein FlgD